MAVREYVGARYVPIFADPAEWDATKAYEPLTIVLHEGNSYTSRQYVPVGASIDNETYWAETGNYNAQVEAYRKEVTDVKLRYCKCYDTVADMKADASININMTVHTNGFRKRGDGGSAFYYITSTGVENGMDVIKCDNGVYANLVIESYVTPEMFGAVNDGSSDSTENLKQALKCGSPIVCNGVYGFTETLYVTNSIVMNGESYFKALSEMETGVYIAKDSPVGNMWYFTFHINVNANNKASTAISVSNPRCCDFKLNVRNAKTVGVNLDVDSAGGNRSNWYNIDVIGNDSGTCETGVIVNNEDSYIDRVTTVNCLTGISVQLGQFNAGFVHTWADSKIASSYNQTVGIDNKSGDYMKINTFYQDSIKTGIKASPSAQGSISTFYYNTTVPEFTDYVNIDATRSNLVVGEYLNRKNELSKLTYNIAIPNGGSWGVTGNNGRASSSFTTGTPFTSLNSAPTIGAFAVSTNNGNTNMPTGVTNASLKCFSFGAHVLQMLIDNSTNDVYCRNCIFQVGSTAMNFSPWAKINN